MTSGAQSLANQLNTRLRTLPQSHPEMQTIKSNILRGAGPRLLVLLLLLLLRHHLLALRLHLSPGLLVLLSFLLFLLLDLQQGLAARARTT